MPVLEAGRGETRTGRLWTCVREDWSAGSEEAFRYAPDHKAEHPIGDKQVALPQLVHLLILIHKLMLGTPFWRERYAKRTWHIRLISSVAFIISLMKNLNATAFPR